MGLDTGYGSDAVSPVAQLVVAEVVQAEEVEVHQREDFPLPALLIELQASRKVLDPARAVVLLEVIERPVKVVLEKKSTYPHGG